MQAATNVSGRKVPPSAAEIDGKSEYAQMRRRVAEFARTIADEKVRTMFEKCFFSSLDTATETLSDGSIFMLTGDIPAMWLRDSSVQVTGYLPYCNVDGDVKRLIKGLLKRQFYYIALDPYANAFNRDPNGRGHKDDLTDYDSPWVWERKFEIDSLCYPLWLAQQYAETTGDYSVYDEGFRTALSKILDTFETEQFHTEKSQYVHSRPLYPQFPTLQNGGKGTPVGYTGLIWNGYRPSDDVCDYGYLVPSNMFATVVLGWLEKHAAQTGTQRETERIARINLRVKEGLEQYAVTDHPEFGKIYVYETDGLGNVNLMDDANVPSLLSLPYLGYCSKDDPIYRNTRRFLLSKHNPYYFSGKAASGVGSPHTPDRYIWHIGIVMQLLTSADKEERRKCFETLVATDADCLVMHEGFHCDDPKEFTRPWFCWANTLFALAVTEMKKGDEIL